MEMDQTLTTLNHVNLGIMAHTHQNFNPPIESGGVAVNFWPQFMTCDRESANVSIAEYPPFKKPKTSQTTKNSRMPVVFNKPTVGIPLRTPLCLQFQRGRCTYGENCQFAHGTRDTQKILPHRQEVMNKESLNEDRSIIAAMKVCRWFSNGGRCPYGARCHFLHQDPARFRKSLAGSIGTTGHGGSFRNGCDQLECKTSGNSSLNGNEASQKLVSWKTRLCNKWEATGSCPFGDCCCFAHGQAELQKFRLQTAMEYGNVSTSQMIPTAAKQASYNDTEKKMQGKKCLFKWKEFEKIIGIYADWIDDMPLVHSSLGEVGT